MGNKEKALKKDGQDPNKKRRRMREAVAERHRNAAPDGPQHDRVDKIKYKPGSDSDHRTGR
jgi:hypothetical protein